MPTWVGSSLASPAGVPRTRSLSSRRSNATNKALHPSAHLITDALASLASASPAVADYTAITVHPRQPSELDVFRWVNILISNGKTALQGTYHPFKFRKYPGRYLAEAQYRLNRRFDLASLVPRLLSACVATPPSPEKWLRRAELRTS